MLHTYVCVYISFFIFEGGDGSAVVCWVKFRGFLDHFGVFPVGSDGEESARNAGDPGLVPGLGRSPGEGNGNPLQYSCLEDSMDRGAWCLQFTGSQRVRHD